MHRATVYRCRPRQVPNRPRPRAIRADADVLATLLDRVESLERDNRELTGSLMTVRAELDGHRRGMVMSMEATTQAVVDQIAETRDQILSHVQDVSGRMLGAIHQTRAIPTHALMNPGQN